MTTTERLTSQMNSEYKALFVNDRAALVFYAQSKIASAEEMSAFAKDGKDLSAETWKRLIEARKTQMKKETVLTQIREEQKKLDSMLSASPTEFTKQIEKVKELKSELKKIEK